VNGGARFTLHMGELEAGSGHIRCPVQCHANSAILASTNPDTLRWRPFFNGALMPSLGIEPKYQVYCDEYGDQGLKHSASEWFIVSAVVIASHREPELPKWISRVKRPIKNQQRRSLHFADLDERMKLRSTRFIGKMPLRCFTLLSHKRNMIGHRNVKCERWYGGYDDDDIHVRLKRRHQKNSYPNWMLKLLLERATTWCERRSMRDFGKPLPVAITIAQRGGFYLDSFKAYLEIDKRNWINGTGTLPGYLAWRVVDIDLVRTAPAANVAGLQLADVVNGAFSRAVDERRFGKCDLRYASNLAPRLARRYRGDIANFSVTGVPWDLSRAGLTLRQRELFELSGYDKRKLVRPGPILPSVL
jgi:hypothetical protein